MSLTGYVPLIDHTDGMTLLSLCYLPFGHNAAP
jgi:hypothetical protein